MRGRPDMSIAEKLARDRSTRGWTLLEKEGITHESLSRDIFISMEASTAKAPVGPIQVNERYQFQIQLSGHNAIVGPYFVWGTYLGLPGFRFFDTSQELREHFILRDIHEDPIVRVRTLTVKKPLKLGELLVTRSMPVIFQSE